MRISFADLGENNTTRWQYVDGNIVFVEDFECFIPEASYKTFGRAQELKDTYKFQLPNAGIEIGFKGDSVSVDLLSSNSWEAKVRVYIDGDTEGEVVYLTACELYTYTKSGLGEGNHTIRLVNAYEEGTGFILKGVDVEEYAPVSKNNLKIQVLGDSITTGYGATKNTGEKEQHSITTSDSTLSYSYQLGLLLDADMSVTARQGITVAKEGSNNMLHLYENYSIYYTDIPEEEEYDVVIVNLGTNDASATTEEYRAQFPAYYKQLLTQIRDRNPNAVIICVFNMMIRNNVQVIEDGIVQAVEEMNDDNIFYKVDFAHAVNNHPSRQEHVANAQILADYIREILKIEE